MKTITYLGLVSSYLKRRNDEQNKATKSIMIPKKDKYKADFNRLAYLKI